MWSTFNHTHGFVCGLSCNEVRSMVYTHRISLHCSFQCGVLSITHSRSRTLGHNPRTLHHTTPHHTTPHHTTHILCVLWCSMRSIVERGLFRSISGCLAWSDFNHTHLHYSHICVNHTLTLLTHIHSHYSHRSQSHTLPLFTHKPQTRRTHIFFLYNYSPVLSRRSV